jgi:hypothetical protein
MNVYRSDSLPALGPQLASVKIKSPIEQHMLGRSGLFRQENVEKRRIMSVREWAELCAKPDLKAPGVHDVDLRKADREGGRKRRTRRGEVQEEDEDGEEKEMAVDEQASGSPVNESASTTQCLPQSVLRNSQSVSPPPPEGHPTCTTSEDVSTPTDISASPSKKTKPKPHTREAREASLAERAAKDSAFNSVFNPHSDWLPSDTNAEDYTPDFCTKLERQYWRNCGLGRPAWYGADTQGPFSLLYSLCQVPTVYRFFIYQ